MKRERFSETVSFDQSWTLCNKHGIPAATTGLTPVTSAVESVLLTCATDSRLRLTGYLSRADDQLFWTRVSICSLV